MESTTGIFMTRIGAPECQDIVAELRSRQIVVTALTPGQIHVPGCRAVLGDLADVGQIAGEVASAAGVLHLADSRNTDILRTMSLLGAWRAGPFIYLCSVRLWKARLATEDTAAIGLKTWYPLSQVVNEFQLRLAPIRPPRTAAITLRRGLLLSEGGRGTFLRFIFRHCQLVRTFVFESEEGLENCGTSFIGGGDLGRAVADALTIRSSGKYCVAGGFCTWRSLIDTVNKYAATKAKFLVRKGGPSEANEIGLPQSRTFLDTSSFNAETGFVPKQSLEELIEEFVRANHTAAAKSA